MKSMKDMKGGKRATTPESESVPFGAIKVSGQADLSAALLS